MTIVSRLNIIAVLTIGAVLILFALLSYNNLQMTSQRNQIERMDQFTKKVFELEYLTTQYLTYGEQRYLESWYQHFDELQASLNIINDVPTQNVFTKSLPSIKNAFELIQNIQTNPELYPDINDRELLLDRARSRLSADIQMLLAVSRSLVENRRQTIQNIQDTQRTQFYFILIPAVLLIVYVVFILRRRMILSLYNLMEGTRNIAEGGLDHHIDIKGTDEHSQLADEFNTMTNKLRNLLRREQDLRKMAEENQKKWEELVEQVPNLIMISIDGTIKFLNSAGLELTGAEHTGQVIGMTVFDLLDETYMDNVLERIKHVQSKNQTGPPTVYKLNTLDRKERYVLVQSKPITYSGHKAMQTVGVDITEHMKYENELRESLEEKTVLLQEIHHRVKNNLAVISGLIQLQAMDSEDEILKTQLNDSQLRIYSMALIHELLYESENFSRLNMKDHISKLVDTILETVAHKTQIDIDYQVDDIYLNINQAIPCALILNELVTNSIKHAFYGYEDGKLCIRLQEKKENVHLSVHDNGIGLPEDFDVRDPGSLGMRIIQTLVRQLKASIEYSRKNGSHFYIKFEKTDPKGTGSHHIS